VKKKSKEYSSEEKEGLGLVKEFGSVHAKIAPMLSSPRRKNLY
jgi:hypothetical protein